jgi:hypothetical protein
LHEIIERFANEATIILLAPPTLLELNVFALLFEQPLSASTIYPACAIHLERGAPEGDLCAGEHRSSRKALPQAQGVSSEVPRFFLG